LIVTHKSTPQPHVQQVHSATSCAAGLLGYTGGCLGS